MRKTSVAAALFLYVFLLTIPAWALTPQQVIELKKAGVSDQTIQMMIQQEEAAKSTPNTMGVREVKDKEGNTVILYSTGENTGTNKTTDEEEKKNVDRAWEMLNKIIIDKRTNK